MVELSPDRFTANMSKAKRQGKIYVDYVRNTRGSTSIAPFSTRAKEQATRRGPPQMVGAERPHPPRQLHGGDLGEPAAKAQG